MTNRPGSIHPKRTHLAKLHADGLSANAIAKQLGVSQSTISRWAKADGLSFSREKTAQAVAAHKIDLAAGRQELAELMLTESKAMLKKLNEPYLVYNFGGKDNTYEEHELESAPVEVRRNAITMAGITFDKLSRIVEKDPDISSATSVVASLEAGILAAADVLRSTETPLEGENACSR